MVKYLTGLKSTKKIFSAQGYFDFENSEIPMNAKSSKPIFQKI